MAGPEASSLAYKLNRLFQTIHPAGRGEYSPEEVARAIDGLGGERISPAYIYMLRKGQRDNPTKKHLELLASFFGVSPAYFFDDAAAEQIEQELDLLAAFREGEILRLAARARGLSPASLSGILKMVDAAREIEGLPAGDDGPSAHGDGGRSAPETGPA